MRRPRGPAGDRAGPAAGGGPAGFAPGRDPLPRHGVRRRDGADEERAAGAELRAAGRRSLAAPADRRRAARASRARGRRRRSTAGRSHDCLEACDVVLVASGTATLEAALYKRPMVISYRMPWLSAWIMRRKGYIPYVGLPNIMANEFVVPELLQEAATPEALAARCARSARRHRAPRAPCGALHRDAPRAEARHRAASPPTRSLPRRTDDRRRRLANLDLFEQAALASGRICGIDEAGRGPLAGPVVAAAVILDPGRRINGLRDSKVLSPSGARNSPCASASAPSPSPWPRRASRRSTR